MSSTAKNDTIAHPLPADLRVALEANQATLDAWNSITPLARNEWICWTISVKQQATRDAHIQRAVTELAQGKRRPCCWLGCAHRTDKPMNATQKWALGKQPRLN